MLAKARKYSAMQRGDYSEMSERDLAEGVIDVGSSRMKDTDTKFDRKWQDHDSDIDESETVPLEVG
jgi:hypothetical protein